MDGIDRTDPIDPIDNLDGIDRMDGCRICIDAHHLISMAFTSTLYPTIHLCAAKREIPPTCLFPWRSLISCMVFHWLASQSTEMSRRGRVKAPVWRDLGNLGLGKRASVSVPPRLTLFGLYLSFSGDSACISKTTH